MTLYGEIAFMRTFVKKILTVAFFLAAGTGALFAGGKVRFQQTYPVSSVFGVNIDLLSGEIDVALWNRNEIRVTVVSDYSDYPVPELSGGVLSCEDSSGSRHKYLVELKVPESFYAQSAYGGWTLSTMTGAINASKLWGDTLYVETMSGSITLSKCEAQIADVTSNTGRVTISQCIISDRVNLESDTGSINFDGAASGVTAESDTGSINISLDQPPVYDCDISCGTGSITISLPENPGFKFVFSTGTGSVFNAFTGYSGGRSGIDTYGAGYVILRAETDTGSIRILRK